MLIVTGISNFAGLPALLILYKKKLVFEFYIGLLAFVSSFMYHSMESVTIEKIFLTELEYHRLGNL
jgi:hypothetical protein